MSDIVYRTIAEIFEIDDPICIEPVISACCDPGYNQCLLASSYDCARLLIDENEDPIAVAVHDQSGWSVTSFLYRPVSYEILDLCDRLNSDVYQETRDNYEKALRNYFCKEITKEFPKIYEDNREDRYKMIEVLLKGLNMDLRDKEIIDTKPKTALDFCCGSGVVTSVLNDMGYETISFDYDASLISCGIAHKRLIPEQTLSIDARAASDFCPFCDLGVGLMFGDITAFNSEMWEDITYELVSLSDTAVISTATEPEIRKIEGWCSDFGRNTEVFENHRDPIYDAWVCVVRN